MTSAPAYPVIKGTLVSTEHYTWNTADSLGRGASAIVYLGRHRQRGTVVAVKVFHDHVHLGYKTEELRELELLRQLHHDNIIKMLDIEIVQSNMKSVLVMEYCEGGSLHHMLDQPPYYYGLSEEEFLLVLYHVSDGMAYLRRENVIHRDIKPGNIMRFITEDGLSVYKLTDFGAARNLDEDESFQSLYGTEEYLHPGIYERAVLRLPTAQSFDARVDLWSLGVTFYHTATGQLPFQPYGGRSNRQTMFAIITEKESGVISGIQNFENGPITWKRDLPESSPLSSGLKSIVIPLLAGLMEPDPAKMIPYDSLFRIVGNIKQKKTINIFHYSRCEDLKIYADPSTTFTGLQDQVAALTDISASDQILLVGGKCLEEVIDPMTPLKDYPPHLLHDNIYLFQREMTEASRIPRPEIPNFPEFMPYSDMDGDSKLAHSCSARGELIKRIVERVCAQQERLMGGLFCLRIYVESRLVTTKTNQDFMKQLMEECKVHFSTFFDMTRILRDVIRSRDSAHPDVVMLDNVLQDSVIRQVHTKASDRITEIESYRDMLVKKLEEVKVFATKFSAVCKEENCYKKIQHHMSVISGVHSRFRRDKSVKLQMTNHDENIHGFERQKLENYCVVMKSLLTEHCLPQLEKVFKHGIQICESLTRCLARASKIEKNINSVLNCQKLLSDKLIKLRNSCHFELRSVSMGESGFHEGQSSSEQYATAETGIVGATSSEGRSLGSGDHLPGEQRRISPAIAEDMRSVSETTMDLEQKLREIQDLLESNSTIIRSLEEPLQSSGSLSRGIRRMHQPDPGGTT